MPPRPRTATATAPSPRARVRRAPARARYEREEVEQILDSGLVAHVGIADDDGQPFVIPMLFARAGDQVYVHGATSSRTVRRLVAGAPGCLTVTVLDGLVLARSIFHHSMNYRSVVLLGGAREVSGRAEKLRALHAFSDQMLPGRWADVRPPSEKELRATCVLAFSLDEASAKVRTGGPVDDPEDMALGAWAGVVPLSVRHGAPEPDAALAPGVAVPEYVRAWGQPGGCASDPEAPSAGFPSSSAAGNPARPRTGTMPLEDDR